MKIQRIHPNQKIAKVQMTTLAIEVVS